MDFMERLYLFNSRESGIKSLFFYGDPFEFLIDVLRFIKRDSWINFRTSALGSLKPCFPMFVSVWEHYLLRLSPRQFQLEFNERG